MSTNCSRPMILILQGTFCPFLSPKFSALPSMVTLQQPVVFVLRKKNIVFAGLPELPFSKCPTRFPSFLTQTAYLSYVYRFHFTYGRQTISFVNMPCSVTVLLDSDEYLSSTSLSKTRKGIASAIFKCFFAKLHLTLH